MSTREDILAAVASTLVTAGVASGAVYRSRREQLPSLPAVVVEPVSLDAEEITAGQVLAEMVIAVRAYAQGDTPDQTAGAVADAAWAALAAEPTFGLSAVNGMAPRYSLSFAIENFDYCEAELRVTVVFTHATGVM